MAYDPALQKLALVGRSRIAVRYCLATSHYDYASNSGQGDLYYGIEIGHQEMVKGVVCDSSFAIWSTDGFVSFHVAYFCKPSLCALKTIQNLEDVEAIQRLSLDLYALHLLL